jgi:27-O-demethylrifamycin SV methyltransferase
MIDHHPTASPPTDEALYDPARHYDRVTSAWHLLLGAELHYGAFVDGTESLSDATGHLTQLMIAAARIEPGVQLLDVGCGTGAPSCRLAGDLGARVTGITTSAVGVEEAQRRALSSGLRNQAVFERRDGMDNGYPSESFDRVWVMESSHLMPKRDRLISECCRVLRPGGRLALCDIVLRRQIPFEEVRRLQKPLALLRAVFGSARMEPLSLYTRLAAEAGLSVDQETDLTEATRPTFQRWQENAVCHRDQVVASLGTGGWQAFVDACTVLADFWDDGTLGYGLMAASKPKS